MRIEYAKARDWNALFRQVDWEEGLMASHWHPGFGEWVWHPDSLGYFNGFEPGEEIGKREARKFINDVTKESASEKHYRLYGEGEDAYLFLSCEGASTRSPWLLWHHVQHMWIESFWLGPAGEQYGKEDHTLDEFQNMFDQAHEISHEEAEKYMTTTEDIPEVI